MTYTGSDIELFELTIPEKLKGVNEYKLNLPEKIEISELAFEIVKKKKAIIAEIRENNGRKSRTEKNKLF
jgi:hypothetical protein